ncbi:hypothetical protein GP486_001977 [Trichoglossum hirsutum]|uniref:Transcriptional coactivator p15 (PC4) C-terminal domain-containing protein n=1 Tax=Trichoglossum hirsutum TaxID=265104 RepID=A0A9P8LG00_9PEZI|nr:hypothetical protein GP486_001977 [Trichoglossum hirsutum]
MRTQHKSRKRSAPKARGNDYDSNDGFVVDSDAGDDTPLAKRAKTAREGKGESTNIRQRNKPAKTEAISNSRRVTISEFKGKRMVNIREYYEKDGKHLPGKKGISMPIDQYSKFMAIVPEVETALKAKGEEVVRPIFDSGGGSNAGDVDDDEDDDEEEPNNDRARKKARSKIANGDKKNGVKKDMRKKNFEATSEEEEDEVGVRENSRTDEGE